MKRYPSWSLVLAVGAAHALLLGWTDRTPPPPGAPRVVSMLTRLLPLPLSPAVAAPLPDAAPPPAQAPVEAAAAPAARRPSARPKTTPAQPAVTRTPRSAAAASPASAVSAAEAASAPVAAVTAKPPASLPHAHVAPSAALDYVVGGQIRGIHYEAHASLDWRRSGDHYQADWVIALPILGQRGQRSEGSIGPAGLEPERFAERNRSERAAHFDPSGGRIRFSANTPDVPLQPGAQDRLSITLQLGALLAANPKRYRSGSEITLQVAGPRDAESWVWEVQEDETLQLAGQDWPTVKLVRAARGDYDTRIELWLARTLDYLPVRLRMTQANGDVADQQLSAPPRR